MNELPGFLDTSIVVRYLTDDPPEMGERAERLIETSAELRVTETVLVETAHVLRKGYGLLREEVVDLLTQFVSRENIVVQGLDTGNVLAALRLCRPSGRVSIPDSLIWAAAKSAGPAIVYSFDARFPDADIDLRLL